MVYRYTSPPFQRHWPSCCFWQRTHCLISSIYYAEKSNGLWCVVWTGTARPTYLHCGNVASLLFCLRSTEQSTWVEHEQSTFFTHYSSIFMEFFVGIHFPVLCRIQSNENGSISGNREILSQSECYTLQYCAHWTPLVNSTDLTLIRRAVNIECTKSLIRLMSYKKPSYC